MYGLDAKLFYAIHSIAGQSAFVDYAITFIGEYLLYAVLLGVAVAAFRAWRKGAGKQVWGYIVAVASALVARIIVIEAIRFFYHRPRPYIALGVPHILTDTAYSFPSGHTIFMFALATGVYRFNKKFAYALYVLGFLIGLARIAGGVHYPSDILGGIVLGIAVGIIVPVLMTRSLRKSVKRG